MYVDYFIYIPEFISIRRTTLLVHNKGDNVYMLTEFADKHQLSKEFLHDARKWYIPLAEDIAKHQNSANKPFFIGINGCQGSGKSTLSEFLSKYLSHEHNLKVVIMSLDDFYLDQSQRSAIAIKVHPLFKTRGVPGTHNMDLALKVITKLRNGEPVSIPRFDKGIDNPYPKDQWEHVSSQVDIVIFEGWCWGVSPQNENALNVPVNTLEKEQDETGVWRKFVNRQLANHYAPLYANMDYWIMLKAPSFECVYAWRLEQEQKLRKSLATSDSIAGSHVMSDAQVLAFIQYYQRLTEHGLNTLPDMCDVVFPLSAERKIISRQDRGTHA
jgi:D-glycerate 3-kinase